MLSQEPLSGQTGLSLEQLVALVHEYAPIQDQVDVPQQEPDFVNEGVPTAQPNWVALLQVPFTGHGSSTILQVSLVCHERVQFQVDACPQVRFSGSGDTSLIGVPRVQVLSLVLSQRGIGDVVVDEELVVQELVFQSMFQELVVQELVVQELVSHGSVSGAMNSQKRAT